MDNQNWHKICEYKDFIKWQYKDSPYRVIAVFVEKTGHWKALFTTSFCNARSVTIRGNCGGGSGGRMKAKTACKMFMEKHDNGCAPPNSIKKSEYKI